MKDSLDFVKDRITSGLLSFSPALDTKRLRVYNFERFISNMDLSLKQTYKNRTFNLTLDTTDDDGIKRQRRVIIKYDPTAPFAFAHTEICKCDGTFAFMFELMDRTFCSLLKAEIYDKTVVPDGYDDNFWDYDISYTVGDFICEDDYSEAYGTVEKPWMTGRFVVLLPMICKVKLSNVP